MSSPKPKKEQPQTLRLPERIRSELNVEKWSIWQPANARTELRERVFEREFELPDGGKVTGRLTIAPTTKGNLTTEDQRVYYALVKIWEERGRSDSFTPISTRHIAKVLGRKWNSDTGKSIKASLVRLRVTAFIWDRTFEKFSGDHTSLGVVEPFNILSDLKIASVQHDGTVNKEVGYFRFDEHITANLLKNRTKPVLFDVVLSFKSETAQILYTHLDLILSDKTSYERRTKELFEDLGLEGKEYGKVSARKRTLERALPELQGKALTTGRIAAARLEPTKDGGDFKLVVRKGKAKAEAVGLCPNVIPLPLPATPEPPSEAEELVRHFHKVFHGADECYPTAKALDQATTLLARHGAEKARHIVEVARREAQKTGHTIATFGGIMQYATAALADFEQKRHDRGRRRAAERAAEAKRRAEADREAEERAEDAEFDERWSQWSEREREAFQAEALDRAEEYGLKFVVTRYRQQPDKTGQAALLHLRTILRTHYRETRQEHGS